MNITFLGQGYKPVSDNSVGKKIIKFLADTDFHSFTVISAFASEAGINGLSKLFSDTKKKLNVTIVIGIDQKGTSKEALEALMNMNVKAFVFYQPASTIFHPKIYLFEGKEKSELIVGSSNLTSTGLFINVEASLLVSINNADSEDRKIVDQLKDYFKGIFYPPDPNLKRLSQKLIDELVNLNLVPTEKERKAAYDKVEKPERKETESMISKIFPKRANAIIPIKFRVTPKVKSKEEGTTTKSIVVKSKPSKLLWESGPLTQRDLNIPKGSNTNPTGSMLFKKGKTEEIDQRHYFREEVFSGLEWTTDTNADTAHLERATAIFKIIIDGKDYGGFDLIITHNPKTDTRSYQQKNSMTSISWGAAKKIIAKEELIGKSANLYRNNKKGEFTLEIR